MKKHFKSTLYDFHSSYAIRYVILCNNGHKIDTNQPGSESKSEAITTELKTR